MEHKGVIQRFNVSVLNSLEKGDLVEFDRGIYSHWAVYAGDEKVIHMTSDEGASLNAGVSHSGCLFTICGQKFEKAVVKLDDFWKVAAGNKAYKSNDKHKGLRPYYADVIIKRALRMIGKVTYNILWSNCEHFATLCRYGKSSSVQAESLIKKAVIATGIVVVGSLVAAVRSSVPAREIIEEVGTLAENLDFILRNRKERTRERTHSEFLGLTSRNDFDFF